MTCVVNCQSPCATCFTTNPSACTSCLFGYTFNSQSNACTSQTTCTNEVCVTCPLGTIPSTSSVGTCTQCTQSSNCARCNSANVTSCVSCLNGYYLNTNSSTCVACSNGCAVCTSANHCITCSSGFTLAV